jgi:hypothetical protein
MPESNDLVKARQEAAAQAALRHTAQDQRTRIGRRVRSIENQLRAQLRRQGRTISIDADITIGQVAQAQVRIEAFRAQMSRGLAIDDNQFTRLIDISQRGLVKLGLRPTLLDDGRAPRGLRVARERWNVQAAQTADREATATKDASPDDPAK